MSTDMTPDTLADLLERLGGVPLERIRLKPAPGTATEQDVVAARDAPARRLCELVDGVLVEKTMGTREALLAGLLLHAFWDYLEENDLGQALGADGMLRLFPGQVRVPDVCFIRWERWPDELASGQIAETSPDLAVEVLSPTNTKDEMARKLRDYFFSGTLGVWLIDPKKETARVYNSPMDFEPVGKKGMLEAPAILPGFSMPLKRLFERTDRRKS